MAEVIFYPINDNINLFLYRFLYQLIEKNNKKLLLFSESEESLKKLDTVLWEVGGESDFLPHKIEDGKNDEYNKLLLTTKLHNPNNAEYLIISNYIDNNEFINSFEKVFFIFTKNNQNSIEKARNCFLKYKNTSCQLKVIEKDIDGKWVNKEEF